MQVLAHGRLQTYLTTIHGEYEEMWYAPAQPGSTDNINDLMPHVAIGLGLADERA